jgi:dienelactone hydrolase
VRRSRLRPRLAAALAVTALTVASAAPVVAQEHPAEQEPPGAEEPEPGTPAYLQREAANAAYALGRQRDQLTNPEFAAAFTASTVQTYPEGVARQLRQPLSPIVSLGQVVPGGRAADPFRTTWAEDGRGTRTPISFQNRYGATIRGSLWAPPLPFTDPVTGRSGSGPLPTVVITTGSIQGFQEMYLWAAQGLAEAGYLVLTTDVQGQGSSDTFPEGGVLGCAALGLAGADGDACPGVPSQQRANFVEGTEDALDWLLSARNPLRALVDTERLGLAGHSLGASAVTEVGNRTVPVPARPELRIRAVVGWDDAQLPADLEPRVPTMGQAAESFFTPPLHASPPDPDAQLDTHDRFVAAGVPSHHVTLRGSTHLEWTYIPALLPASSAGERVAMHLTLAWFDRFLKGARQPGAPVAEVRAQRADALERLTADRFDGSSDRSAIGTGPYVLPHGNTPVTIGGDEVAAHLSFHRRSAYAVDGRVCEDVRAGC